MTSSASTSATIPASRRRRARSQRPERLVPCSMTSPCSSDLPRAIASTVPSGHREPTSPDRTQGVGRGLRLFAPTEEAVDGRTGAADVGPERSATPQLVNERRRRKVVGRKSREVGRAPDGGKRAAELGTAGPVAASAVPCVEGLVHALGRLLPRAVREHDGDPVVLREIELLEASPVARPELRAGGQEERNVGAELGCNVAKTLPRQRPVERLVREPQGGRRVGAAAAEARCDGDPLPDPGAPTGFGSRRAGKSLERTTDERVLRESFDAKLRCTVDRQAVAEIDALVDGRHLVLSVVPAGPDDEREVQLGRRGRASHGSASASATNSSGFKASARVDATRPRLSTAAAASSRVARPASSSEFGSVVRRCANAADTTSFTRANSGGNGLRRKATSAESTFGRGRKTVRDTG